MSELLLEERRGSHQIEGGTPGKQKRAVPWEKSRKAWQAVHNRGGSGGSCGRGREGRLRRLGAQQWGGAGVWAGNRSLKVLSAGW